MPSELERKLREHRQRLIDREEAAVRELLAAYDEIERGLRIAIADLQRKIRTAQDAGQTISPAWFSRERRLSMLIDQVKQQVEKFGRTAAAVTTREQRTAITIAVSETDDLIRIIAPEIPDIGSLLDTRAIETAVGMMADGSPIHDYYKEQLAPKVADAIRREVIDAAAKGTDFRTIQRRLLKAGDITRQRALMVARTEVNRVRREATRARYQENEDLITGWEWAASKSRRTCPACLAMDGRIFKLKDEFPQHVNCRCTMIPVIDGVERPKRTLGADWLAKQPDDVLEDVLGKHAAAAYSAGDIELKDLVGWRNDKRFGRSIYTKKLSAVMNGAK